MKLYIKIIFCFLLAVLSMSARAAYDVHNCDSCNIVIKDLREPLKLSGRWLFTRDDSPANKEVLTNLQDWTLVKAPGPWKPAYQDGKNFTVGWYRGNLNFDPALVGQEVVLLINAHVSRVEVFVDGKEVYSRPRSLGVQKYYSIQPIPVRFKISKARQVIAIKVDTPLMTGIYQLPFELRAFQEHDKSLTAYQFWGGDLRMIVGYTTALFGLFFLMVYKKTEYGLYLMAGLSSVIMFPFFVAPNDYLFTYFEPETLLYWHYIGLIGVFFFFPFCQYFYKPMPKTTWVLGTVVISLGLTLGAMAFKPNLNLYQHIRSVYLISLLVVGIITAYCLTQGMRQGQAGTRIMFVAMLCFLGAGIHDVLLALGVIRSISMIFAGASVFIAAMLYVACASFANTFLQNKVLLKDLKSINDNLEGLVEQRTEQLREKSQDIASMLENMPQGVLTVVSGNLIHPEYSAYLETIFETENVAGQKLMELVFSNTNIGSDVLSQIEAAADSCIGEDRMNFEFNSHLFITDFDKILANGQTKSLALSWSPICDANDNVEKLMLCVRDVTELKRLENEASKQKRELDIIGEILAVSQEKFQEFIDTGLKFADDNKRLLEQATGKSEETINLLFRNMHTIKGNARTYGLRHMTNVVHETEQAYDDLRKNAELIWDAPQLLDQVAQVRSLLEEYSRINDTVLGRKGPGRRGSVEKFVMVERDQVQQAMKAVVDVDMSDNAAMRETLTQIGRTLNLIGTERIDHILAGPLESLPSLAKELGKEAPTVRVEDHGIVVRTQISSLLKNLFAHLLRNSMDHGIELASERLEKGKPAAGQIEIEMLVRDGQLCIMLRDDGRGMAVGKIRQRAIERGLIRGEDEHSPEQIAQFIFMSGFSTAEQVTEVSGRGVGMEAVKGFLEKEEGSIEIQFVEGHGNALHAYRPFQLLMTLPDKYATSLDAALTFEALRQRAQNLSTTLA
ncbi:MAG: hypothetical protein EOP38_00255 [Rubrivivax sp.]|nr:MAG: hypothetical protein EOP38_00255 [Rubrivivax sp.]